MENSPQTNERDSVTMRRRSQWAFVSIFLLFLVLPWIVEIVSPGEGSPQIQGESLLSRLKQLESRVKNLAFFVNERPADQAFMEGAFREGNTKVYIGQGDWLYYRPDLEAVYGKGPFYREPSSVAREKVRDDWESPLEVIDDFAKQLEERGIELVIVPVPTKPMLSRSGLGLESESKQPRHYLDVLSDLSKRGIKTVNLLSAMESLPESSRFLQRDTHWTPEAMALSAKKIAEVIRGDGDLTEVDYASEERVHSGDLAGMLDRSEKVGQRVKLRIPTGAITDDSDSRVVLLGDSFVNIYDEPGLGFGEEKVDNLGAGFAAHFSANLNHPIQTIAINGDGATAVRREFASLPDKKVRSKKIVVWVLSGRDLLLPELPARRAGIRWMPVEFREAEGASIRSTGLTVSATVSELSQFSDPRETAYKDAVYSLLLSDPKVESGTYLNAEVFAFAWAFKDRVLQDSSRLERGKRYRFILETLQKSEGVANATQVDDFFRTDLDPWFIKGFELLP